MFISVYESIGGWKPCLYDSNGPVQTGFGFATPQEAEEEATAWGKAEGIRVEHHEYEKCTKHPERWAVKGYGCTQCHIESMRERFHRKGE